jgi:MATE family multidrug resistance protein
MTRRISQLFKTEVPPTFTLALPIIFSQLGQQIMGLVDSLMVAKLGPEAIGGVAIGSAIYSAICVFGIGLTLGLDFLVAYAFGKKAIGECGFWLVQAVYLTLFISIPLTFFGYWIGRHLTIFGITGLVLFDAQNFLSVFIWSLPSFLLFFCFRTYLQAMNLVKMITVTIILGNILNVLLDWIFIYGHLGFHPYLTAGPGIATFFTRFFILFSVITYTLYKNKKHDWGLTKISWKLNFIGIRKLISLGLPSGLQLLLEVAVFSLATLIAGKLSANSLAAHSIVLNIASITFMVPLGLALATSIRVGQALGQGLPTKARDAGWASIILAILFMTGSGLTLFLGNKLILNAFSNNIEILEIGKRLLLIAAFFQIADGIQTVATGALRGLGDTKIAMTANLLGHWCLDLPVGFYLCFYTPLGIQGLWIGLTTGLVSVASILLYYWDVKSLAKIKV